LGDKAHTPAEAKGQSQGGLIPSLRLLTLRHSEPVS
jgi:hypothetical protein